MNLAIRHRGSDHDLGELPGGDDGITATIAAMQAIVDHAVHVRPTSMQLARIAGELNTGNVLDFAENLWTWCRDNVRFRRDPLAVELVRHPGELLKELRSTGVARGDCDDLSVLACSIIAAAGYRPVLITVGREQGGRFQHVFFGLRLGDELDTSSVLPLDPQERTPAGSWPARARRVKLYSMTVSAPAPAKKAA